MKKNKARRKKIIISILAASIAVCTELVYIPDDSPIVYAATEIDQKFEDYLNEQGFPESYKEELRELHKLYPNWVFQAFHTGLDWDTVIKNEMLKTRNLIEDGFPSSQKDTEYYPDSFIWKENKWNVYSAPNWVQASEAAVKYYMDPRNFLQAENMFQFELLTYNEEAQTLAGVQKILSGTFMDDTFVDGSTANTELSLIESSTLAFRKDYICGLQEKTSVKDMMKELCVDDGTLQIVDADGKVMKSDAYVGTGCRVQVLDSEKNILEDRVFLLYGDVNGDGKLNNLDRADMKMHVYKTITLTDSYLEAADVNHDGKVNNLDRADLKMYVYKEAKLDQVVNETYAELFARIGRELNVSPYMLASRVCQEQGLGTSALISGTVSGYEGYYNYFNIGAYGTTREDIIKNGMDEAVKEGWNSRYKAIVGGANKLCSGHIWKGQDTLYLQKFDVETEYYGTYWHQYQQGLMAPYVEGSRVYRGYQSQGALNSDSHFIFKIPVYENMNDSNPKPVQDGNPNYKLKTLSVEGYKIDFDDSTYEYTIRVPSYETSLKISAEPYAVTTTKISGTGNKNVVANQTKKLIVATQAQNGTKKEYVINIEWYKAIKPEETKPAETTPEETKPAETTPEETTPEETTPEETKPAETKSVETTLSDTKEETKKN